MRKIYTYLSIALCVSSTSLFADNHVVVNKNMLVQSAISLNQNYIAYSPEQGNNIHLTITPATFGNGFSMSYELNCSSKIQVKMFNILGTLVYQKMDMRNPGRNVDQHDTGPLFQGIYMIEFEMQAESGNTIKLYNKMNLETSNNKITQGSKPELSVYDLFS